MVPDDGRCGDSVQDEPARARPPDGRCSGAVAQHVDEFDKRDFAVDQAQRLGLSLTTCAATGDSRSALPLFEVVGLSIGFNASPPVRRSARSPTQSSKGVTSARSSPY